MSDYWLAVIIIGVGTYLYRISFIGGGMKSQMPPLARRALEYVPVSVMAALVGLGFFVDGQKSFALYPPSLLAALAASLLALKLRRDVLTIAVGLAVYWLVEIL